MRLKPCTQLFVDGQRRIRARTPNEGEYFYTKRPQLTTGQTPICLGLTFFDDDLEPWVGLKETGRVVLFHNWVNSYNCVREIDWRKRRIYFSSPAGAYFLGQNIRYYVDNIREGLDSPASDGWKVVGKLSPAEWYRVEIEFVQGESKHYNLRLTGGDETTIATEGLPMRIVDFEHCNWLGFSRADTKKAVFYVDNVALE